MAALSVRQKDYGNKTKDNERKIFKCTFDPLLICDLHLCIQFEIIIGYDSREHYEYLTDSLA